MSRRVLPGLAAIVVLCVVAAVPASAAKSAKKLDSDKGKGKTFILSLNGTASPTGKFIVKAKGKRGVRVTLTGLVICTTDGDTASDTNVDLSGKLPFKKTIKPQAKNNDSCSAGLSLNVERQSKRVEVKAKLLHKK